MSNEADPLLKPEVRLDTSSNDVADTGTSADEPETSATTPTSPAPEAPSPDTPRLNSTGASQTAAEKRLNTQNLGLIFVALVAAVMIAGINSWVGSDAQEYAEAPLKEAARIHSLAMMTKLQLRLARESCSGNAEALESALIDLGLFRWYSNEIPAAQRLFAQALSKGPFQYGYRIDSARSKLMESYEKEGKWREASALFGQTSGHLLQKSMGYSGVEVKEQGERLALLAGDKTKAAKLHEEALRSRLIPRMEVMGKPEAAQEQLIKSTLQEASNRLCAGELDQARFLFREVAEDDLSPMADRCQGNIMLFVSSVAAKDYLRAERELKAAQFSYAWLKDRTDTEYTGRPYVATFLGQYSQLLRWQGKSAEADAAAREEEALRKSERELMSKLGDWE